jgi:hypothetical protein
MPTFDAQRRAAELQRQLTALTGNDHLQVRPYGKHLLIQVRHDGSADTIARLTEVARNSFTSAFRSHTGRWEPLPGTGDLAATGGLVATLLAPYFDPTI